MNFYQEFETELTQVFAETEMIISKFPEPLNKEGLAYLDKFNVLKEGSTNNYICYLLPFWLMDMLPIDRETCIHLSRTNILAMLYFFIIDDRMDSKMLQRKTQLPLAHLLYMKFHESCRQLFPVTSTFWSYNSTYMTVWAEAVSNEHQLNFMKNPLHIARKASPVKLISTSACLLSGKEDLVSILSLAIDHVLTTLQMADDWVDWQDDVLEGNYNCLAQFIHSKNPTNNNEEYSHNRIKQALYLYDQLKPYTQVALNQHKKLISLNVPIPHLIEFHQSIVDYLLAEASKIEVARKSLALGGLNYWLSKKRD